MLLVVLKWVNHHGSADKMSKIMVGKKYRFHEIKVICDILTTTNLAAFVLMLQELGKDAAVPLTNSLFIADKPRINQAMRLNRSKLFTDMCPFRHGKTFSIIIVVIISQILNIPDPLLFHHAWGRDMATGTGVGG